MSTVGEAGNIPSKVFVNEFTTVVSSYLFLTGSPHFSSGAPSIAGNSSSLVSDQNSLVNYVNLQTGGFQTTLPSSSATQLTDLANIIASCVEDTSSGFSNCQTLKTATTVTSLNPSNTLMSFVSLITQLGNISAQNQADLVNLANTPTSLSSGGSLTSLNGSTSIPPSSSGSGGGRAEARVPAGVGQRDRCWHCGGCNLSVRRGNATRGIYLHCKRDCDKREQSTPVFHSGDQPEFRLRRKSEFGQLRQGESSSLPGV